MPLPPSRSAYIPQATEPSEPEPEPEPKPKPKVETQTQTPTPTPTPTPQPQPQPGHGFIRRHRRCLRECAVHAANLPLRVACERISKGMYKLGTLERSSYSERVARARGRPPAACSWCSTPTASRTCVWERGRSAYPSSCSTCALRLRTPSPSTLAPTLALALAPAL